MKRHATRADSKHLQFMMRVPEAVRSRVEGRVVTVELPPHGTEPGAMFEAKLGRFVRGSLHTRNPEVADSRHLIIRAHLSKVYAAVKNGPVTLSPRQIQGLAGQVYRLLEQEHGEDPGTEAEWIRFKAFCRAAIEGRIPTAPPIDERGRSDDAVMAELLFGEPEDLTATIDSLPETWGTHALEQRVGRLALWVMDRNGLQVAPETHVQLLRAIADAALQFARHAKQMARGDYRPDPDRDRFPEYQQKKPPAVTLSVVFDRWKAEVKPTPSTVSTWRGVVRSLTSHLGEDVAITSITKAQVIGWKDALVERGLRPATINDQHLAGLKALLNFAGRNGIATDNVAQGVRLQVKARAGERMLPYSDDDVARLLHHASRETSPAKRWLPMLAVLTGARIGELAQAWGDQVRMIDGVWVLEIRPAQDGGTLKNAASERTAPLHPALVEAGFVRFAQACGNRPMFYAKPARRGTEAKHPSKGVSNHLSTWVRSLPGFDDPRKSPLHGARHWFKVSAVKVGLPDSVADRIQGHTSGDVADEYRRTIPVPVLHAAVSKIPVPALARDEDGAVEVTPPVAETDAIGPQPARTRRITFAV